MLFVRFDSNNEQAELCTREYRDFVDQEGSTDIWNQVPEDLHLNPVNQVLYIDENGEIQVKARPEPATPPTYLLYNYLKNLTALDATKAPKQVIFPQQVDISLYKDTIIVLGERVETVYYASFDEESETYSDPLIKVNYVFTRDEKGYLVKRTQVICWRLSNDTWSEDTKSLVKYIKSTVQKERELTQRRRNIINQLKSIAKDLGIGKYIKELFKKYSELVYTYVNSGSEDLYEAIEGDNDLAFLKGDLPNGLPARASILNYISVGVIRED